MQDTAQLFVEEHGSKAVAKIKKEVVKIMKHPQKASAKEDAECVLHKMKILHQKLMERLKSLPPGAKTANYCSYEFAAALESQLYSAIDIPSLYHALHAEES